MKMWNKEVTASQGVGGYRAINPNFENNQRDSEKKSIENYKALENAGIKLNNTMTPSDISKALNKERDELKKQYGEALAFIKKTVGDRSDQQINIATLDSKLTALNKLNFDLKNTNLAPLNDSQDKNSKLVDVDTDIAFLIDAKKESESLTDQMLVAGLTNFLGGNYSDDYRMGSSASPAGGIPAAVVTTAGIVTRNTQPIQSMIKDAKTILNAINGKPQFQILRTKLEQTIRSMEKLLDKEAVEAMPKPTYDRIISMVNENNFKTLDTIIARLNIPQLLK
jgi:hypothetical protein